MNFIVENWEALVGILVAIHGVALMIVNLTPTPKDNETLAKVYPFIEFLAGLVSEKTKQPKVGTDEHRASGGS